MSRVDVETLLTQTRTGCFTLRTDCTECAHPLPLNGPQRLAHCANCQSELDIPEQLYAPVMLELEDRYFDLAEDERHSGFFTEERYKVHYELWRAPPACEKCAEPFPIDRLGPGTTGNFVCVSCSDPGSTYPAPAWLKRRVPTAVQVYSIEPDAGESQPGEGVAPRVVEKVAPVVMACPQCSSSLSITADLKRVHACQYCSSEVYLPDAIWLRLHPAKKIARWYVAFQGESSALARLRRKLEQERLDAEAAESKAERARLRAKQQAERDAKRAQQEQARKAKLRATLPQMADTARRKISVAYLLGAATLAWSGAALLGELTALPWWVRLLGALMATLATVILASRAYNPATKLIESAGDAFDLYSYEQKGKALRTNQDVRGALLLPLLGSWLLLKGATELLHTSTKQAGADAQSTLRQSRVPLLLCCLLLGPGWPVLILAVVLATLA